MTPDKQLLDDKSPEDFDWQSKLAVLSERVEEALTKKPLRTKSRHDRAAIVFGMVLIGIGYVW